MPLGIYKRTRPAWNKGLKTGSFMTEKGKQAIAEFRKIPVKRICKVCQKEFWGGGAAMYCLNCHPKRIKTGKTIKEIIENSKSRKWREARVKAVERDKGTCQVCGKFVGNSIDVHHRDERGYQNSKNPNQNLDNLICLCHSCHLFVSHYLAFRKSKNWNKIQKLIS